MNYSNAPVPEGTNITQQNPFKQLLMLGGILAGILLVSVFIIMKAASWGATYIPFEYEVMLAEHLGLAQLGRLEESMSDESKTAGSGTEQQAIDEAQAYLQKLVDAIARAQNIPNNMPLTAHLVLDDTVNAYATIGGHMFFHQGLLEKLKSENALTMLIAHEVGHIYNRDPVRATSGALLTGLFIEWVTSGSGVGSVFVGDQAARLVVSGFSREQESQADAFALSALQRLYGHSNGGGQLFEVLLDEGASSSGVAGFWSSHPETQARLDALPASVGDIQMLEVDFKF